MSAHEHRPEAVIDLREPLRSHAPTQGAFDWFLNLTGKVHRQVKHRTTLEFAAGGRRYFIKIHRGCGWGEILKDLFSGRPPILGADNEWKAVRRLEAAGIPTLTVAGIGWRGTHPARRESFVVTEALDGMRSLEALAADWGGLKGAGRFRLKRALIGGLSALARAFHGAGVNHRDFYLCHFLVRDRDWGQWRPGEDLTLRVIDLHRAQIRGRVPRRWLIKDLAGLLCSALDAGVTLRDTARFIGEYQGHAWSRSAPAERRFWRQVGRRAVSLYRGYHGKEPPKPWGLRA